MKSVLDDINKTDESPNNNREARYSKEEIPLLIIRPVDKTQSPHFDALIKRSHGHGHTNDATGIRIYENESG